MTQQETVNVCAQDEVHRTHFYAPFNLRLIYLTCSVTYRTRTQEKAATTA